jgi:malate/lactate dehydrogenase
VVGRVGVISVLQPKLSAEERSGLEKSAENLRKALEKVRK